ncbi:MAG TPA: efflux transporter outer membrane subunit, partial [Verrucomicrobium sp.]|nr:efflux transporter outer membrane subunit [Verrucomicrobium sp.]
SSQQKTLDLMQQRFQAGTISEADVARARSETATVRADLADAKRQREETLNLLAVLCGQPASRFSLPERPISGSPRMIPAGIPAALLERRPDVSAAERTVAARNEDIGVETAGFFPTVSLTGQGGYLSKDTSSLFAADSRVWSIGPSVSVPVTGYFVTKAKVDRARAVHQETVAKFRQSVLGAVKDVETALIQIRYRREQGVALQEALDAALKATSLTRQLYDGGSISYLELLDAERTSLLRERQSAQLKAQGHIATVALIRALGGAW